jgi:IclR family transcriptional regulator, acetate operon repressor
VAVSEERGTLGTLRNAAVLLDLLNSGPAYQQLSDLAERSNLTVPTVHRLLRSLMLAGLVEQDPLSARYGLGVELVRLSERYLSRLPVLRAAAPFLVELRNATKATVLVAVLARDSVVYVERVDGEDAGGVFRQTHRLFPALDTAAGRLMASRLPEMWERIVMDLPTAQRAVLKEQSKWAEAPYVMLVADDLAQQSEIAVPLNSHSPVHASLCVAGDSRIFTPERLEEDVAPHLQRTARAIESSLSYG